LLVIALRSSHSALTPQPADDKEIVVPESLPAPWSWCRPERPATWEGGQQSAARSLAAFHAFGRGTVFGEREAALCFAAAHHSAGAVRARLERPGIAFPAHGAAARAHAAGMMARCVAIAEPTVAPMPKCTSGIAAMCLKTMGSRAAFIS
jgi:hypothetical protein